VKRLTNIKEIKLGIQSYTFRNFSFEKALEMINKLGINYVEISARHVSPSLEIAEKLAEYEKIYNIRFLSHGVNPIHKDRENIIKLLEFAKQTNISVLTADPDPDSLDILDDILDEYKIAIAIHNHGPGHRYDTIRNILNIIKDHNELIGLCLDTGHLARAGDDIVDAVTSFDKRLYSIHLKDIDVNKKDTIIGEGILNLEKFFEKLKETDLLYWSLLTIEYEPNPENPLPGVKRSIENIYQLLKKI